MAMTQFVLTVVLGLGAVYLYDAEILYDVGNQTVEGLSSGANALYDDYYAALSDLYSNPEKKYVFNAQITVLALIAYFTLFKRAYDPSKKGYGGRAPSPLTKAEQETLIEEWSPKPLIDNGIDTRPNELGEELVLTSRLGPTVEIEGVTGEVLNLSGFDFLGMSQVASIREKCKECLTQYGCGSCGPRGFYGTSDKHLELETALKDFFGTEEAIIYSDAACTMSSIIPAFAKRGDVVVADIGVSESAIAGIELSRSTSRFFKHNDVEDLEQILAQLTKSLKRKSKPLSSIRRYIVVEGLYRNGGDFAPLAEILKVARKYKYRVILDDSMAIGTVGPTGRGSLERAGLSANDVDFIAGSLSTALGSVGGFCTGSHVAIDHQRLAGSGYCFSASSPPFTCVAALEALRLIDEEPARLEKLKANIKTAQDLAEGLPGVKVISAPESPMIYLELADEDTPLDNDERFRIESRVQGIADACLNGGIGSSSKGKARRQSKRVAIKDIGAGAKVLVSRSRYVYPPAKSKRPPLPNPSLRICINADHTEDQLRAAFATLTAALQ